MFIFCFSDTSTDVPSSSHTAHRNTVRYNTRKHRGAHTSVGTAKRAKGCHLNATPTPSGTSWLVEKPNTDRTSRSAWLPPFTTQLGYIGQKCMASAAPYEFLELFLDDKFWQLVTVETNRYMVLKKAESTAQDEELQHLNNVTVSELKKFFSLYFVMGIVVQPELGDYWQTTSIITQTKAFPQIMSKNRWEAIWSHLHFVDNAIGIPRGHPGHDRLFKIREVIRLVTSKFSTYYQAAQKLSLDDMTIDFNGHSSTEQRGYKAYVLSEAKTGYALQLVLYTGKGNDSDNGAPPESVTSKIVQELVAPHYGLGHVIFTDSCCTSPDIADILHANKCGMCGMCNANRSGMPHDIQPTNMSMRKGDPPVFWRSGHKLACTWHHRRRVTMLSTVDNNTCSVEVHSKAATSRDRNILRPTTLSNYFKHIGGVNLLNQRCQTYLFPHSCRKWYKKLFSHIVMTAMVNAHIIYTNITADKRKLTLKDFICEISQHYAQCGQISIARPQLIPDSRFTGGHFPYITSSQSNCAYCSTPEKRVRTNIACNICFVHLCVRRNKDYEDVHTNCFSLYHTQP